MAQPLERIVEQLKRPRPKFAVGQVWTDANRRIRATIVAITKHKSLPLIIQTEDGDVWAHRADGSWPYRRDEGCNRFDLTTLISDKPADPVSDTEDAEFVRNHGVGEV